MHFQYLGKQKPSRQYPCHAEFTCSADFAYGTNCKTAIFSSRGCEVQRRLLCEILQERHWIKFYGFCYVRWESQLSIASLVLRRKTPAPGSWNAFALLEVRGLGCLRKGVEFVVLCAAAHCCAAWSS